MEWLTIVLSLLSAVIAAFLAHGLALRKVRKESQHAKKIEYMIEAIEGLVLYFNTHPPTEEARKAFERSIVLINLFGSECQMDLVNELGKKITAKNFKPIDFTPMFDTLRDDLRNELNLKKVSRRFTFLQRTRL